MPLTEVRLCRCFEDDNGSLRWAASGNAFNGGNGCSSCKMTGYASIQCSCLSDDGKTSGNSVKDLSKLPIHQFFFRGVVNGQRTTSWV